MTERFAAVDIGSNSCLLLIVEKESATAARVVLDIRRTTRIAGEVAKKGAIGKDAAESLTTTLDELQGVIREHSVERVVAAATQVYRSANNGEKIAGQIKSRLGWDLEIISGEEEARLSYLAATTGLVEVSPQRVVADVGGGSTEVIVGDGKSTQFTQSFAVGAVNLTDAFALGEVVSSRKLSQADGYLSELFIGGETQIPEFSGAIVIVGGTISALGGLYHQLVEFDAERVHGTIVTADWLEQLTQRLASSSVEQRAELIPFDRDRAGIILAGTLMVRWLLNWSSQKSLIISNRGLRWGLLLSKFRELESSEIKQ